MVTETVKNDFQFGFQQGSWETLSEGRRIPMTHIAGGVPVLAIPSDVSTRHLDSVILYPKARVGRHSLSYSAAAC